MKATKKNPLRRKQHVRARRKNNFNLLPRIYDLSISRINSKNSEGIAIPKRISMVYVSEGDQSQNALFIDKTPIPNTIWRYDILENVIRWEHIFGGGEIRLTSDQKGGQGVVGLGNLKSAGIRATATVQFRCNTAEFPCVDEETCPIKPEGDGAVSKLNWYPDSDEWKNGCWHSERLLLQYISHQESPDGPPVVDFTFTDLAANTDWVVGENGSSGTGQIGMGIGSDGLTKFLVHFSGVPVPPIPMGYIPTDTDCSPSGRFPTAVWPFFLDAEEDAGAVVIEGAMHTVFPYPSSKNVGFQGIREFPTVTGYYRSNRSDTIFGVFDGKIEVNGEVVAKGHVTNNTLFWSELSQDHQRALKLPAQGQVRFDPTGSRTAGRHQPIRIERVSAEEAIDRLSENDSYHPAIGKSCRSYSKNTKSGDLSILELSAMTPFDQDENNVWYDAVQERVTDDFFDIMVDAIPDDLWESLFGPSGYERDPLTGEVALISNIGTENYPVPSVWYESLSTAVLTSGMSEGDNDNCKLMNGPRANQWLQQEVPTSEVYEAHGLELFSLRWPEVEENVNTQKYLDDQAQGTQAQKDEINQWREFEKADIDQFVVDEIDEDGNSVNQQLKDVVDEAADYALDNDLYWAHKHFAYLTQTSVMANIETILADPTDNTKLSRYFQQNSCTLTALDKTGFFARQYNLMFNTFLGESILNSMYGFEGDIVDFSIIVQYLETFVDENLESANEELREMAEAIDEILQAENAEEILHDSIDLFFHISEGVWYYRNLEYIAYYWQYGFSAKYPEYQQSAGKFGTALATGMSVMSTLNMVTMYKHWDELTPEERAGLVMGSIQRAVQITAGLAKGSVTMGTIFKVDGLSKWQRVKGASKAFLGRESGVLTDGMLDVGNSMAQWLGDTYGTYSERQKWSNLTPLHQDMEIKKKSMTKKVFGRNLDEFMATRVGPVMILGSIGLSIANIAAGDTGVDLAIDIMEIVAGALEIFALVGGYMVEIGMIAAEGIAATMVSFAGPLAIVAALAGLCLLLYRRFHKEPDPVEEFVNNEVAQAGFKVLSRCSAIDYAVPYVDDNGENKVGFSLTTGGNHLVCDPDGNVSLGSLTETPSTVWVSATSGTGMSEIAVVDEFDGISYTTGWLLSLMSDNTVCFHERVDLSQPQEGSSPTVVSQMWYSTSESNAITNSSDSYLVSMNISFESLTPDAEGTYNANTRSGHLVATSSGVTWKNDGSKTIFNLAMEFMAPNNVFMADLNFMEGVEPFTTLTYGPSFGINPSNPTTFTVNPALPSYLSFNASEGTITINPGIAPSGQEESTYTYKAENAQGSDETTFKIKLQMQPS